MADPKRKFQRMLPTNFFIFVKVIAACPDDHWSYYDSFLIYVAKRFNTAYYLLRNAGRWSGGETRSGCRWLGVVETSAKLSDSTSSRSECSLHSGELRSLFLFGN